MTTAAVFLLHIAVTALVGLALARPGRSRARCAAALGAVSAAALVTAAWLALLDSGERELEITHRFVGLVDQVTIGVVDYPIGSRQAPGWAWPLVVAVWAGIWAGWLASVRTKGLANPFWPLLAWAWTTIAVHFGFELTAAPEALVRPLPYERALYPVAVTGAFLLAVRHVRFFPAFFSLVLMIELGRLPLAILGTYATDGEWNIGVDVHGTTEFVNPLTQLEMETTPKSSTQLGWLIWAPHAFLMPAFYAMSTGGIAFCTSMFLQYSENGTRARAAEPDSAEHVSAG